MKIRHIVFASLTLVCALTALLLGGARNAVTEKNMRDFAAESYRGASENRYTQLAMYLTDSDYLTPDGMMEMKNTLEGKLNENGVADSGYLLSASMEHPMTVTRDTLSIDVIATVYFGDYFGLHPQIPASGGYVDESAATTDFCVIDDLAAWRLFGSTNVCGMDVEIDGKLYTVSAVLPSDRSIYAPFYGEKPRVYLLYSSAAMRDNRITFTSLEAVLPDPITDAAYGMLKSAASSYGDEIVTVTGRFTPAMLWDNIKGLAKLGVMEGESYPYYENVARVMETKCAIILVFEGVAWLLAAAFLVTLLVTLLRPIFKRLEEKRLAKKRHAIY